MERATPSLIVRQSYKSGWLSNTYLSFFWEPVIIDIVWIYVQTLRYAWKWSLVFWGLLGGAGAARRVTVVGLALVAHRILQLFLQWRQRIIGVQTWIGSPWATDNPTCSVHWGVTTQNSDIRILFNQDWTTFLGRSEHLDGFVGLARNGLNCVVKTVVPALELTNSALACFCELYTPNVNCGPIHN
jgi:hypothetical protein